MTAASLDRLWFVPSRSALFAEFESRGVVFVASGTFVVFVVVVFFGNILR
jgi:hypothetical protein